MLHLVTGTDSDNVRRAVAALVRARPVSRITDAHTEEDLLVALAGPGMFGEESVVVLDGVLNSDSMRAVVVERLGMLRATSDVFVIQEGTLDAATRKLVEKYAETSERFDAPKKAEDKTIFALANALQAHDKKALWIGLAREFSKGSAPEAIHGLLFWGAKQAVLKARTDRDAMRARELVSALAVLPHESRRKGEELSYALERFALSL